ncbi:hypothetical protein K438DRAFT_1780302 [Mycena galopus ATCC 62051]|nr:hypothetical protein K438DRAFT_1780302 [Mycena galopus ATCC 62051]
MIANTSATNLAATRLRARPSTGRRRHAIATKPGQWAAAASVARNASGHPVFPMDQAAAEDALLGENAGMKAPVRHEECETARVSAAASAPVPRDTIRKTEPLTLDCTGLWTTADRIEMFAHAVNLLRWVNHGDVHAAEYLRWTITRLLNRSIRRTEGESAVLQYQNQSMERYNAVVRATKIGHTPGHPIGRSGGYPWRGEPRDEDQSTIAGSVTSPRGESMDVDIPNDRSEDGEVTSSIYLGSASCLVAKGTRVHLAESPINGDNGRKGTSTTLLEMARMYLDMGSDFWPIGMRVNPTDLASTTHANAHFKDIAAWFTINALAPAHDKNGSLVLLLSVPGIFNQYATIGEYAPANCAMEHYPFVVLNAGQAHIVAWLVQHGIVKGSDALRALESFACSRRNVMGRVINIQNTTFEGDWLNSPEDVGNVTLTADEMWKNLHFGPVRPGVMTLYPEFPAGDTGAAMARTVEGLRV